MPLVHIGERTAELVLQYFWAPNKRLFIGYLLSAAVLAFFVYRRAPQKKSFVGYLLDRRILCSGSALVDYQLVVVGALFKVVFLSGFLYLGAQLTHVISTCLHICYQIPSALPPSLAMVGYTVALFVAGDASVYAVHRLLHRVPVLWAFHRIHHTATTLTPLTQLRLHPVEVVFNSARQVVVFGIVTGAFDYLADGQVALWQFCGVGIFTGIFFLFGANLRHSHIALRYPRVVEHVFVSPAQHQIHHSVKSEHKDRNFGSKLALWDWIFGTLVVSQKGQRLRFGVGYEKQSIGSALLSPFL